MLYCHQEVRKMEMVELDGKLTLACDKPTPDLDEIRELIVAGADTNQLNKYGDNIFDDVFTRPCGGTCHSNSAGFFCWLRRWCHSCRTSAEGSCLLPSRANY